MTRVFSANDCVWAESAGSLRVGQTIVPRFGYGTMRLPGPGVWGPPRDPDAALAVLRRAVELGVRLIDTSGYYGPDVANKLVAEALHPYPEDLVIATKVGARRDADRGFVADGAPEAVRRACQHDATVLRVDALDLVHARFMPDSSVPFTETVAALAELRQTGLVRHIGVSNVTSDQLQAAQAITAIASVENLYNARERASTSVLEACERDGLPFLPFHPLGLGALAGGAGPLADIATELHVSPAQVALAWLLGRSPVILPIPGTTSVAHLEENLAAAGLQLSADQIDRLTAAADQ
jgi:pyridoxine 4-dehydrogenase